MKIAERYKLIFNWEGIRYEGNIAYFKSAAFTGPVLTNTARILPNDHIELDFTKQNLNSSIFLSNYYYKKLENASARVGKSLEPILIITLGIMIAIIMIAVLLPIYGIMGKMEQG